MTQTFELLGLTLPVLDASFYINTLPFFIVAIGSLVVMMQSCYESCRSWTAVRNSTVAFLSLTVLSYLYLLLLPEASFFGGTIVSDHFARVMGLMIAVISLVTVLLTSIHHSKEGFFRGEIASVFLIVTLGSLVMVSCAELVTLFVGLEMSAIGIYCLVGYIRPTRQSQEGAIKYLVLGALASGFMLFGFALLYAGGGSLRFDDMLQAAQANSYHNMIGLGVILMVAGLAFKLALVPFHLWAPDAYESAPTPITALMATSVKVTILAVFMRVFALGQAPLAEIWLPALVAMGMASMILANVMALVQTSVKRMLAYSSIGHSGYMAVALCGIAAMTGSVPFTAIIFYLVSYSIMSLGVFAILAWLESDQADNLQLEDFSGLASKHPWAAFTLAALMFSFAGLPPTAGFIAKFLVFNAALQAELYGLVVVGAIGSAIALYYYLRLVVCMYMQEPQAAGLATPRRSYVVATIATTCVVLTVVLGTLAPNSLIKMTEPAASTLVD